MLELFHMIFLSQIILLWIISGLCRSLVHTLLHHYPDFKKKFMITNDGFWNPAISWEEKYEKNPDGSFKIDSNGNPIRKRGVLIFWYDAFHRTNTIELLCDFLREGIYLSLLASLLFELDLLISLVILLAGTIISGTIKILISFNLGYDKIWR